MSVDLTPALALAARYRLGLKVQPLRGLPGDILSKGVGSSQEFQDFRPYVPGDDPRYIDWAAVARTDQLILRLHRADVRMSVEVLLDASRSLAVGSGAKAERAAQCALLMVLLARRSGAKASVWVLGDNPVPLREGIDARLRDVTFDGRASISQIIETRPPRLETGSFRVLVSDFLFPHDPFRLSAFVAAGASGGAFVQVLAPEERDPPLEGHVLLRDAETGEERPMSITAETARLYRERFRRLTDGLSGGCMAARLPFIALAAERPLDALCRGPLVRAGLLEPA